MIKLTLHAAVIAPTLLAAIAETDVPSDGPQAIAFGILLGSPVLLIALLVMAAAVVCVVGMFALGVINVAFESDGGVARSARRKRAPLWPIRLNGDALPAQRADRR
jgi:hypothetical protein